MLVSYRDWIDLKRKSMKSMLGLYHTVKRKNLHTNKHGCPWCTKKYSDVVMSTALEM